MYKFQFTPLREGRLLALTCLPMAFYFNSRPSARGDHAAGFAGFGVCISIHAPPRGATSFASASDLICYFNSRPSARGDPILSAIWCNTAYFNSRPSARGDMVRRCRCWSTLAISIHAPPRGATRGDATRKKVAIFQFTPLREGRLRSHRVKAINYYFNSRPSARGDNTLIGLRVTHDDFNSRPSARGDLVGKCAHGAQNNFNSRPSARGDFGGFK